MMINHSKVMEDNVVKKMKQITEMSQHEKLGVSESAGLNFMEGRTSSYSRVHTTVLYNQVVNMLI